MTGWFRLLACLVAVSYCSAGLVCPVPAGFVAPTRSEPECSVDNDCETGELCCSWFADNYCLRGIDPTPKSGQCQLQIEDPNEGCIADYGGCRFDSECSSDEKCCRNINCGYGECTSPLPKFCTEIGCGDEPGPDCKRVIDVRPNGEGCGPVCKVCDDAVDQPESDLECPSYPFFFNVPPNPNDVECQNDTTCGNGEICCRWGGAKLCKDGVMTTPKPGSCPAKADRHSSSCKMDYGGCSHDSLCTGDKKCCKTDGCGYKECYAPASFTPPSSPSEPPKMCTRRGCGGPQAGPNCKDVEISFPNGEGCEPQCRICVDPPTTPVKACTKIGCGPKPDKTCKKVKRVRPNGKGCRPVCKICVDKPKELACPSYDFWFDVELTEPLCESDENCKADEKCCQWGSGKQCKKGLDKTPKEGTCPASSGESSNSCIMDYGGCDWDSECDVSEKCCYNSACKYKECRAAVPAAEYIRQLRLIMENLRISLSSMTEHQENMQMGP